MLQSKASCSRISGCDKSDQLTGARCKMCQRQPELSALGRCSVSLVASIHGLISECAQYEDKDQPDGNQNEDHDTTVPSR